MIHNNSKDFLDFFKNKPRQWKKCLPAIQYSYEKLKNSR